MTLRAVILTAALVASCAEAGEKVITPGSKVQANYKAFMEREYPTAFALSEDGESSFYHYCDTAGACDIAKAKAVALQMCQINLKRTRCRIYYEAPHGVVWDGPPVVGLDPMTDPESPILKDVEKLDPAPAAQD